MRSFFVALGFVALSTFAACGGAQETASIEESLAGGCRVVCPKCHPGEVCPMIACVEDCSPAKQPCIDNVMCPINYTWSSHACSCVPNR
jgi:hypothetical protein